MEPASQIPPQEAESAASDADDEKETARVEAFSDGVFAIAITLLILDLKVPRGLPPGADLARTLAAQWPSWVAFLCSFLTIGIMWLNHHRLFSLIRRSDDRLLILNGLLLLGVTIVPFPTSVLAEHLSGPHARVAATLYSTHGLIVALFFIGLWRHAALGRRLLGRRITPEAARDIWRQYRYGPLLYMAAVGLSLVSAYAGVAANLALAIFFTLPPRALAACRAPAARR